jgi:hypothetical protein
MPARQHAGIIIVCYPGAGSVKCTWPEQPGIPFSVNVRASVLFELFWTLPGPDNSEQARIENSLKKVTIKSRFTDLQSPASGTCRR